MAVDGATKEKKKKKKVKFEDVQDEGHTHVMEVCRDVSVQTVVKKEEPLDVNIRDGGKRASDAAEKKKKKKKVKEEGEANSPVCCNASVQTTVKTQRSDTHIRDAPEKKKKKKKIKEEEEHIREEVIVIEDGDHLVSKKKKAKKQGYEEEVEGVKKKKKKKEVEAKEEEADLGHGVEIVKKEEKNR